MARPPLILALDASTTVASVALFDGERVLSETTWLAGREHSTQLLEEVSRSLERLGRTPADITGIGVACGPGSFTGVRVAISVAKGLAAGLRLPVWGVGTLDVLAHAVEPTQASVWAVLDAGRGRLAVARYVGGSVVDGPRNVSFEELAAAVQSPATVIGELGPDARAALETRAGVRVAPPARALRRASHLAALAWAAARSGAPGDPSSVDAVYLGRQA